MSGRTLETVNPATGERVSTYTLLQTDEVFEVARRVGSAQRRWRRLSVGERSGYLPSLAKVLRNRKREYATLMTTEMGKPIAQSESEVEKCAWTAELYAERAEEWLRDEVAETDADLSYVTFEPLGVVLSIMPWNFPFWQALRFAIPALVAGNASILRHSSSCPGSAMAIEGLFREAGFPDDVFRTAITDHEAVARLVESPLVHAVSLTGSVAAGTKIGGMAGANLKKCVLELGGSDPYLVLDDADVEKAAVTGAAARLLNSGQSCIAAKRFIVQESVGRAFVERFVEEFRKKRTGDPMDPHTDVGPLVSREQVAEVHAQVRDALSAGAKASTGGAPMQGPGAFFEPTVLENVGVGMRVMREEVFGPVASVYFVKSEEDAVRLANDTEFGLGASVWTRSPERARRVSALLESGMVFVNSLVKSDPRMPFGGVKRSGLGRELSKYGLKEFVNVKSVNYYGLSPS